MTADLTQYDQIWKETRQVITMRVPCKCGSTEGYITEVRFNDVVRCLKCDTFAYNAPRTETGKPQRSIPRKGNRTKEDTPNLNIRYKVLERAGGACELCHAVTVELDVDHLIPVAECRAAGYTPDEYNQDWNLAAMCPACNSGKSNLPIPYKLWLVIQLRRIRQQK